MVAALGAPGCQLQRGVGADPDDRERAVLALVAEAHDLGVEADAGLPVVDGENEMVQGRHGEGEAIPSRLFLLGYSFSVASSVMWSLMALTTVGSSSVVTSPSGRSSATSRRSRRMILPLRVLGSSGVSRIWRGLAMGPISCATWSLSSATSFSPASPSTSLAPLRVTKATMAWPVVASFAPTTAASATAGWLTSACSTSVVEMRCPEM